ncbi:helix-turn-helix domain-containing protein [Corynebacterium amycolatum]|uniref:Helix-turn-helix domain-containing protein n=1 Tax=Corynebacterium amycolatum TaxID=43765 RepID=A0AAW9SV28_CORAY|nr:helix-turn-helix domain-containing protein [Corynebacterium amycolatum]MDK7238560.1 helix-turn-helix domain-containing protein [Corynebacterium amycolatum]MDK7248622.1 helix-turn-helix domain-containing protein [Corynebacterium amycolatum]
MKTISGVTYFSPKEVSEHTSYSEYMIQQACRRGELKAFQRGKRGRWNIPEDAIQPWLDGQEFYGGDAA